MPEIENNATYGGKVPPEEYEKILDILQGIQVNVRSERFRQGRLYERNDGFADALRRTAEKRLIRREQEGDKYWESEVERLKKELQD